MPILLSQTAENYKVLAAAYIVPPLLTFAVKYWVVKPLRIRLKIRKVRF